MYQWRGWRASTKPPRRANTQNKIRARITVRQLTIVTGCRASGGALAFRLCYNLSARYSRRRPAINDRFINITEPAKRRWKSTRLSLARRSAAACSAGKGDNHDHYPLRNDADRPETRYCATPEESVCGDAPHTRRGQERLAFSLAPRTAAYPSASEWRCFLPEASTLSYRLRRASICGAFKIEGSRMRI